MSTKSINAPRGVFIVGNGFDLSLNLPTSYWNFYKKKEFFPHDESRLCQYIEHEVQQHNVHENSRWCDIEGMLAVYANVAFSFDHKEVIGHDFNGFEILTRRSEDTIAQDRLYFEKLNNGLLEYLRTISFQQQFNTRYPALKVLNKVLDKGEGFFEVFTFNYTDLLGMTNQSSSIPIHYLHGSLEQRNSILGIADGMDVYPGYEYMIKTLNPNYASNDLYYSLKDASIVILYGHALGDSDKYYFESFINDICTIDGERGEKRKIFIFTRDQNSRMQTLIQIRRMSNNKTFDFFSKNEVKFIYTEPVNEYESNNDREMDYFMETMDNLPKRYSVL